MKPASDELMGEARAALLEAFGPRGAEARLQAVVKRWEFFPAPVIEALMIAIKPASPKEWKAVPGENREALIARAAAGANLDYSEVDDATQRLLRREAERYLVAAGVLPLVLHQSRGSAND